MKKYSLLAIAICIFLIPVITNAQPVAGAQPKPAFIIFLKESPPPDDPNDWFVIFPTTISAQAILAAGYHPFQWANSEDQAFLDAANLLTTRFPQVCHKGTLRFVNFQTMETVFVNEFAEPKPFGFTYQAPPMCSWEALALQGNPSTVQVGPFTVTLSKPPRISRPVINVIPPPPPPPRHTRIDPNVQRPPQTTQTPSGGNRPENQSHIVGPEPLPIPEDDIEGAYEGDDAELAIPQPIPNEEYTTSDQTVAACKANGLCCRTSSECCSKNCVTVRDDPNCSARCRSGASNNQNESTTPQESPPASKYPDIAGTWRRSEWTQYATHSVSQSGNRLQWSHDYPWGAGMRHEEGIGTVEEISGSSASITVEINYTEPDGSHNKGYYSGRLSCDENGKALSVSWSNNSSWVRIQ